MAKHAMSHSTKSVGVSAKRRLATGTQETSKTDFLGEIHIKGWTSSVPSEMKRDNYHKKQKRKEIEKREAEWGGRSGNKEGCYNHHHRLEVYSVQQQCPSNAAQCTQRSGQPRLHQHPTLLKKRAECSKLSIILGKLSCVTHKCCLMWKTTFEDKTSVTSGNERSDTFFKKSSVKKWLGFAAITSLIFKSSCRTLCNSTSCPLKSFFFCPSPMEGPAAPEKPPSHHPPPPSTRIPTPTRCYLDKLL